MTSHDFWDFEKVMRHRERLAQAKIHSFDAGGVPCYGLGTTGMAQRSQDANVPLREIQQAVVDKWMLNKSIELSRERTESRMGRRQGRQSPLTMRQEHKELILSQRTRFCEKVRAASKADAEYLKTTRRAAIMTSLERLRKHREVEREHRERVKNELLLAREMHHTTQQQEKVRSQEVISTMQQDLEETSQNRIRLLRERAIERKDMPKTAQHVAEHNRCDAARIMAQHLKKMLGAAQEQRRCIVDVKKDLVSGQRASSRTGLAKSQNTRLQQAKAIASPLRSFIHIEGPALRKSREESRLATQKKLVKASRDARFKGGGSPSSSPSPEGSPTAFLSTTHNRFRNLAEDKLGDSVLMSSTSLLQGSLKVDSYDNNSTRLPSVGRERRSMK